MERPARSRAKTRGSGSPETQTARPAPQGQCVVQGILLRVNGSAAIRPRNWRHRPPEPPDTRGKRPDYAAGQGHACRTPKASRRAGGKKNPRPRGRGIIRKKKEPAASYFPPVRSIIGVRALDFRVRNGNGYVHPTMATGTTNARKKIREAAPSGKQRAARRSGRE